MLSGVSARETRPHGRILYPVVTIVLFAAFFGGSALLYRWSLKSNRCIPGIILGDRRLEALQGHELTPVIRQLADEFSRREVELLVGGEELQVPHRELGLKVDQKATAARALAAGKSGSFVEDLEARVQARGSRLRIPLAVELERDAALSFFLRLKEEIDHLPMDAQLDLERQAIKGGKDGFMLDIYDSMAALEGAVGRGRVRVKLAGKVLLPSKQSQQRTRLDISHVIGHFTTVYSLADKAVDRGHNLKVGAAKLDRTIIAPGATISFNEIVGPRNKEQGYRTAPVISAGELIDGMAGGACQLSSTLFAAAFFAGLGLESSRPHTRPSSYIKMGLDAAVAYPTTDLVLSNPYPFPVVIHFKVNQGKVNVRILGKKRPWRLVAFEREVKETIPFETKLWRDEKIPSGKQVVSQLGVPGFRLERRRLLYRGKKEPEKVEQRELRYPPTTQIIKQGAGPADPEWTPPKERAPFGEVKSEFKLEQ